MTLRQCPNHPARLSQAELCPECAEADKPRPWWSWVLWLLIALGPSVLAGLWWGLAG